MFSVPLAVASAALVRTWLAEHDIRLVATSPTASTDYAEADLSGSVAIVVGGREHDGLDAGWTGRAEAVRIPMAGQADSINAAMTAAVLVVRSLAPAANSVAPGTRTSTSASVALLAMTSVRCGGDGIRPFYRVRWEVISRHRR